MMSTSAGTPWLAIATRPEVAAIEVSATSSGIMAAVSEPSTSISTMIVSGIEIIPALARPLWITESSFFSVSTPTGSTEKPAWRVSTWSTASAILSM